MLPGAAFHKYSGGKNSGSVHTMYLYTELMNAEKEEHCPLPPILNIFTTCEHSAYLRTNSTPGSGSFVPDFPSHGFLYVLCGQCVQEEEPVYTVQCKGVTKGEGASVHSHVQGSQCTQSFARGVTCSQFSTHWLSPPYPQIRVLLQLRSAPCHMRQQCPPPLGLNLRLAQRKVS